MSQEETDSNKSLNRQCQRCGDKCDPKKTPCSSDSSPPSCYTDLYVIGKIWLVALKTALLGSSMSLVPVVLAAHPPPPPEKPPPMKYKDLPLYESPHNDYNEYVENKTKCPEANVKLMRSYLKPYVTTCRKEVQDKSCQITCAVGNALDNFRKSINESKRDFTAMMRDSQNLTLRRAVVAAGAGLGYILGAGKSIPRRTFLTAAGATAGGALCFPKETDETFRSFTYYTGKTILGAYNWVCRKDYSWRERIACKDDLPSGSGKIVSQCPPKK